MAHEEKFKAEVSSSYPEFWRYNVALMCGCFDAQDVRTDFTALEDSIAHVGANLTAPPEHYPAHRLTMLETAPADHIVLYVYIIPHTLPRDNDIAIPRPFPLEVRITAGGREVLMHTYEINQWSGASIELRVHADGTAHAATKE